MAVITSAQSGNWSDPATWVGGVVPDPRYHDVVVAGGHSVHCSSAFTCGTARSVTVAAGASLNTSSAVQFDGGSTLEIAGNMDVVGTLHHAGLLNIHTSGVMFVYGAVYFEGDAKSIYGAMYVSGNASAILQGGCVVFLYGSAYLDWSGGFYVYSGATLRVEPGGGLTVQGYLSGEGSAYVYIAGILAVESGANVWLGNSGNLDVESGGLLSVHGWVSLDYFSSSSVSSGGGLIVHADGGIGIQNYSTYTVDWDGLVDVFGTFNLNYDSYLNVNYNGQMRVFRTLNTSGQMYGGGRIDILRREARVNDCNGNSLFVFDQAYGFGQTAVA